MGLEASGFCPGANGIRCSPLYKQTGLVDRCPAGETILGGSDASRSFREDEEDRWEQIGYAVKT